MPKYLYCGTCGVELKTERRAVKGEIYDFVLQHECEGGYNAESDLPNVMDLIKTSPSPIPPKRDEPKDNVNKEPPSLHLADVRKKDDIVTSTAPQGLLQHMQNQQVTEGVDLDELNFDLEGES